MDGQVLEPGQVSLTLYTLKHVTDMSDFQLKATRPALNDIPASLHFYC